jgi:uncharacterized protein (TIGR00251 family)
MPELPSYVTAKGSGAILEVFVQPRAAKEGLVGLHGGALKIKVTAPPVDGRANEAVGSILARILEVPRSSVSVVSGSRGRHKRVEVTSMGAHEVASVLGGVLSSRAHEPG